MFDDYLKRVLNSRVYDVAQKSPLDRAPRLSARLGRSVWLKREDLQPVFSFKLRGAYNRMAQLSGEERRRGVVAASAGNHAQGVALAASRLGVHHLIVMPVTTPEIKVSAVEALGGKTLLFGDSYDDALKKAHALAEENQWTFIHAYDDPDVIAGQGTVGMEILQQAERDPRAIFVPVGGGGLIAGVAAYVKSLKPHVRVIGVEPDDAACLHAALQAGSRVRLDHVGLFTDGVAVKEVGQLNFEIAREGVDEVVLVNTDEVCAAIKDIFDETRTLVEPAGALAVAGAKRYAEQHPDESGDLVAVVSGANVNFDRLRHVTERAEIGERGEVLLNVTIPEVSGSFRDFSAVLGKRSVTEFNYRYAGGDRAHVFVGLKVNGSLAERQDVVAALQAAGYEVDDLTDNELAKVHIRYMVGGRSDSLADERVFRFVFPERPGALRYFLDRMDGRWNISMFHYRNHGSAYGRVLIGIQVPEVDLSEFDDFLQGLGYQHFDESDNLAVLRFLR